MTVVSTASVRRLVTSASVSPRTETTATPSLQLSGASRMLPGWASARASITHGLPGTLMGSRSIPGPAWMTAHPVRCGAISMESGTVSCSWAWTAAWRRFTQVHPGPGPETCRDPAASCPRRDLAVTAPTAGNENLMMSEAREFRIARKDPLVEVKEFVHQWPVRNRCTAAPLQSPVRSYFIQVTARGRGDDLALLHDAIDVVKRSINMFFDLEFSKLPVMRGGECGEIGRAAQDEDALCAHSEPSLGDQHEMRPEQRACCGLAERREVRYTYSGGAQVLFHQHFVPEQHGFCCGRPSHAEFFAQHGCREQELLGYGHEPGCRPDRVVAGGHETPAAIIAVQVISPAVEYDDWHSRA